MAAKIQTERIRQRVCVGINEFVDLDCRVKYVPVDVGTDPDERQQYQVLRADDGDKFLCIVNRVSKGAGVEWRTRGKGLTQLRGQTQRFGESSRRQAVAYILAHKQARIRLSAKP